MNKSVIIALAASMAAVPAFGGPLTADQALSRAFSSAASSHAKVPGALRNYQMAYSTPELYVFNSENDGFLITSADDQLRPVLGIADSGSFSEDAMPEPMKIWLEQLQKEASAYLAAQTDDKSSGNVYDNYATWQPIEPICTTKWNQLAPYNATLPKTTGGQQCVTGCAATAMAQVIKALKFCAPKGTVTYTPAQVGKAMTFDYDKWKPDFDEMLDNYTAAGVKPTDNQINEVAELMRACGMAVNTNYSTVSGAGEPSGALKKYLGFDNSTATIWREYYSSSADWEALVYSELAQGRPMLYSGTGSGGHGFVCDGYQGNGLFHFNWGWGGQSDGYFALSALNPRSQGVGSFDGGYNTLQYITSFVQPGKPAPDTSRMARSCTVANNGSFSLPTVGSKKDSFNLMFTLQRSLDGGAREVGISLYITDKSGKTEPFFIAPSAYKSVGVRGVAYNYEVDFTNVHLPAGEYEAYVHFAEKGRDGHWPIDQFVSGNYTANDHYIITIDGTGKRSYKLAEANATGIEIYRLTDNGLYAGESDNLFSFIVANNSTSDFVEPLSILLKSADGKTSTKLGTNYLIVRAGEPVALSLKASGLKAGTYRISAVRPRYGDIALGSNSFEVTVKAGKRPSQSSVTPQEFDVDGLRYRVNQDGTVHVCGLSSNVAPAALAIPSEVKSSDGKQYAVTGIADEAFDGAKSLTSVEIPSSVTFLGHNAFRGTINMQTVTMGCGAAPYETSVIPFYGMNSAAELVVSSFAYDSFKAAHHSPFALRYALGELKAPESASTFAGFTVPVDLGIPESASVSLKAVASAPELVDVFIVNNKLMLKGKNPGKCTVTVSSTDESMTATIEVSIQSVPGTPTITLSEQKLALGKDVYVQLEATFTPAELSVIPTIWSSSNPEVATVDSNGNIHTFTEGTTTITVASTDDPTLAASCEITVLIPAKNIYSAYLSYDVNVGQTVQITATVRPTTATIKELEWNSLNPEIATVDSTGLVTGVSEGKAIITAKTLDGTNITKEFEVTVSTESGMKVVETAAAVSVSGRQITANGVSAEVYSLMGRKIAALAPGESTSQLAPGVYVVSYSGRSVKFVVR